jgi:hypothetical protein
VIQIEREFNRRAGLTPLSPHGEVFDVLDEALDAIWEEG